MGSLGDGYEGGCSDAWTGSSRSVIDWYVRRVTTNQFTNRRLLVLPAACSGLVVAGTGEPADADGLRPLGQVRQHIQGLVAAAELTSQELAVLRIRGGLAAYPVCPAHLLRHRVPQARERDPEGIGERWLREIYRSATRKLDAARLATPGPDAVAAGPVPDPALDPWFLERVSPNDVRAVLEQAAEAAMVFLRAAGHGLDARGPMREVLDYRRARCGPGRQSPRSVGRSRAHAIVGLAAWALVMSPSHDLGVVAATTNGRVVVPHDIAVASEALGHLLSGATGVAVVRQACADTLHRDQVDHAQAQVMAQLLLRAFEAGEGRIGTDAEVAILRTVVRVMTLDEDVTALGLVRRALTSDRLAWQTVDAAQAAIRVASGWRLFERADELYREVESALAAGISLPSGRARRVEEAEFRLWNLHQRILTLRRRIDARMAHDDHLKAALRLVARAAVGLDEVKQVNRTVARGDYSEAWDYRVHLRTAEVHLAAAARRDSGDSRRQRHEWAATRHGEVAQRLLAGTMLRDDLRARVAMLKFKLRVALHVRDDDGGCTLVRAIDHLGWPMSRVLPLLGGVALGPGDLPPRVRGTIADAVAGERRRARMLVDGSSRPPPEVGR